MEGEEKSNSENAIIHIKRNSGMKRWSIASVGNDCSSRSKRNILKRRNKRM